MGRGGERKGKAGLRECIVQRIVGSHFNQGRISELTYVLDLESIQPCDGSERRRPDREIVTSMSTISRGPLSTALRISSHVVL